MTSDAQMTMVDHMALVRKLRTKKIGINPISKLVKSISNGTLATGSEST